ncbi:MAG TPA: hypothetical protein VJS64_11385, partial [Pyrinomonadaceae bacterium]|nr:hypothetical protein [Pyrinomonadaceae bacterium]
GFSNFGTVTVLAFSGGRTTAPFAAVGVVAAGLVSLVEVVSVPGGFGAGLAATSAGDGSGDGAGGAGETTFCASAPAAQSTIRVMSNPILFIMIFPSKRFSCR